LAEGVRILFTSEAPPGSILFAVGIGTCLYVIDVAAEGVHLIQLFAESNDFARQNQNAMRPVPEFSPASVRLCDIALDQPASIGFSRT
jgi:hypothetical protein